MTGITISDGGGRLTLSGKSLSAEAVPEFLKRLSASNAFAGHQFDHFELMVDDEGLVAFTITGPDEVGAS